MAKTIEDLANALGDYWILDADHKPIRVGIVEWGKFFKSTDSRIVAQDQIGDAKVSTVFLGIDHGWGDGAPVLFETMVFGGPHDQETWRCCTWKQAEAQHEEACSLVRGGKS